MQPRRRTPDHRTAPGGARAARTEAARGTRRTVHGLLLAVVAVATVASLAQAVHVGGQHGAFALPVLVESLVIVLGVVVATSTAGGLRVDTLTLFLGWETLRGCIAPAIIQWFGSGSNFFWRPGTVGDAVTALWLGVLFASVVVASRAVFGVIGAIRRNARFQGPRTMRVLPPMPVPVRTGPVPIAVLVLLGLVGLVLRFPTPGSVAEFLSGSVDGLQGNDIIPKGPIVFIGMVLRPLLVVGLVMLVRARRRASRSWWWLLPPMAVAVVFGLGSYGLNRASIVFVTIALVLVVLERSRRSVGLLPASVAVVGLGAFFFFVGTLRSTIWLSRTGLDAPEVGIVPALQSVLVYAASPMQLSGAMPWADATGSFTARTFVLSMLGPVPGIPDGWRTQSGVALFNNAVYHSFVGRDQLVPAWFESYLSFGVLGIVVIGAVVALLIALADVVRRRASSFPAAFAAAVIALWVSQPSAVGTYSIIQNVLYFALPTAVILLIAKVAPMRSRRAGGTALGVRAGGAEAGSSKVPSRRGARVS
jgi:hypothetical protein